MKRRIAILLHDKQKRRDLGHYVIGRMAEFWQEQGLEVVFLFGTGKSIPADLLLVHIDLSVVPDDYLHFAQRYPIALNAQVKDIRKSRISKIMVGIDDDYQGKVIVKTDQNYSGIPERLLTGSFLSRALFNTCGGVFGRLTGKSDEYRVYDDIRDVPQSHIESNNSVIEKFLPEMRDGFYFMREYAFLGDKQVCILLKSTLPNVKWLTAVSREMTEPHPDMVTLRRDLKIDYGKFDYVVNNGKPVLLDINKTTGITPGKRGPDADKIIHDLASGIFAYFRYEK